MVKVMNTTERDFNNEIKSTNHIRLQEDISELVQLGRKI